MFEHFLKFKHFLFLLVAVYSTQAFALEARTHSKTPIVLKQPEKLSSQSLIKDPFVQPVQSELVLDLTHSKILIEKNINAIVYPASLTKLLTLEIVFSLLDNNQITADQLIPISTNASLQSPTKLNLPAGSTITVDSAIKALAVHSANDIATAFAEFLSGSEENFARLMNQRAQQLGMKNTSFSNASGLPYSVNITTARDITLLASALILIHPQDLHYLGLLHWSYGDQTFENTNKLLKTYPGMDISKTGYIRASGFNLFASVQRNNTRLVAVVFGYPTAQTRDKHMVELLNHAWSIINTQ